MKSKKPAWLEKSIFYQIYPQSYYDSNADGIGDLHGIMEKLDYVKSLGANAIWINPCFTSPFQDAGYDISDYYTVAPRYGSNQELEKLFLEAKLRGIRIILDLVPGHTSIEHPWFSESQKASPNQYTDWYVWNNSVWDAPEPDLPIVRGLAERDASYITNFFFFQPALNYGFAEPDPYKPWQQSVEAPGPLMVKNEIKNIIKFWLDKGASGFRVDMAASLVKRDPDHKKTSEFWRDIRTWLDREYPEAVLISEWGKPIEALNAGFHIDMLLGFDNPGAVSLFRKRGIGNHRDPYGWSFFDEAGHGDIMCFLDDYMENYTATKGLGHMALITGNHDDHPRIGDNRSVEQVKLGYLFLLTMPGTPIIYYGDEIGMHYYENLPSKEGGYARTGVRTPMQWNSGYNAGFSSSEPDTLYLPICSDYEQVNVEKQEIDKTSLLNTVKQIIAIKMRHTALDASSDYLTLYAKSGELPFIYMRKSQDETLYIALNPSNKKQNATIAKRSKDDKGAVLFGNENAVNEENGSWVFALEPISGVIIQINNT